jgi:DNA-binding protein HU-alpha
MATSPPKQTAAKPARPAKSAKAEKTPRAASAKAKAEPAAAAKPAVAKPATGADTIKLRDLVDTVAAATGQKKPDAKTAVEAVLAALGAGLAAKSVLVVPPLGKLRVAKSNGSVLTLKLRLADASRAAGLALADDEEDS